MHDIDSEWNGEHILIEKFAPSCHLLTVSFTNSMVVWWRFTHCIFKWIHKTTFKPTYIQCAILERLFVGMHFKSASCANRFIIVYLFGKVDSMPLKSKLNIPMWEYLSMWLKAGHNLWLNWRTQTHPTYISTYN